MSKGDALRKGADLDKYADNYGDIDFSKKKPEPEAKKWGVKTRYTYVKKSVSKKPADGFESKLI